MTVTEKNVILGFFKNYKNLNNYTKFKKFKNFTNSKTVLSFATDFKREDKSEITQKEKEEVKLIRK